MKQSRARLKVSGGYTIIEVMIVLAVSGLILIAALAVFAGKPTQTAFNVAVRDAEAEVRADLNDVISYQSDTPGQFTCDVKRYTHKVPPDGNNDPRGDRWGVDIIEHQSDQGTNTPCIVLGKIIIAQPNNNNLAVFTAVGSRLSVSPNPWSGTLGGDNGQVLSTTLENSLSTTDVITNKDYPLGGNAYVKWSKINDLDDVYKLIGFYADFGSPSGGSSTSLQAKGYRFYYHNYGCMGESDDTGTCVKYCIEDIWNDLYDFGCGNPLDVTKWRLCLAVNDSKLDTNTAEIIVNISSKGATTRVMYPCDS